MTHAVINDNSNILYNYLLCSENTFHFSGLSPHVPVTLKHFQILARLGKAPNYYMYHEIEQGAEFFFDEEDYLKAEEKAGSRAVKTESTSAGLLSLGSRIKRESSPVSGVRRRKRPRRMATNVHSYAVPDSDDETIANEEDFVKKPKHVESSVQQWIMHLGELMKGEQRKFKEKKKWLRSSQHLDRNPVLPRVTFSNLFHPICGISDEQRTRSGWTSTDRICSRTNTVTTMTTTTIVRRRRRKEGRLHGLDDNDTRNPSLLLTFLVGATAFLRILH